jgi:DNA-binding NtrC family response regulator
VINRAHLPPDFGHAPASASASQLSALRFPIGTTVEAAERELIQQTLTATNNKTRAAEILGISLKTLHNKLKEYEAARSES